MDKKIKSGDLLSFAQLKHHVKIYAGPGAGKTHFIVENVKNIVKTDLKIQGSLNRKVLCITYTNSAVNEIKSRLTDYKKSVDVYTIHGFIIEHIIKPYQSELKKHMLKDFGVEISVNSRISSQIEGLGILHGQEKKNIFDYINKELNLSEELSYSKKIMGDVQIDIKKFSEDGKISIKKSNQIKEHHTKVIKKYTWSIVKKLTHDEILYFGYKIVTSNSTIAYALRVQFPYIFVDEFQDTNPLQSMLINNIGSKSSIIAIIGDLAQSIFSFQGAKPSKFKEFNITKETTTCKYMILGNRRSSKNIVSLCNYIRKSDGLVQEVIKSKIDSHQIKQRLNKKVCFIVGDSSPAIKKINELIVSGAVILTRTWAAAFNYIEGVSLEQKAILKRVYNSYFTSPIDLRYEISGHNNVTWVRAFKFIFLLFDAYKMKSVADILKPLDLYLDVKNLITNRAFTVGILFQLNKFLEDLFRDHSEFVTTVEVIKKFNELLKEESYSNLYKILFAKNNDDKDGSCISCFNEFDRENLIENVSNLEWQTSYILFKRIFSNDSKYMTVHQAKGLEWEKVIVSLEPSNFDRTTFFDMFMNPQIAEETVQDEFTRLFYVACSRAENELYIHLKNDINEVKKMKHKLEEYRKENDISIFFEFIS